MTPGAPARGRAFDQPRLLYRSASMAEVVARAEQIAATSVSILLEGESGVGKDLLAAHIHACSARAGREAVVVNVAAIAPSLLAAELFGVERGAYTSADQARRGLFREADGSSLFLDEIGELPLAEQAALLRAVEAQRVRPVGGSREATVDVRFIAATNRDLWTAVEAGQFRRDLFFRLAACRLRIPPLRERPDDIPLLLAHAYARATGCAVALEEGFTDEALHTCLNYPWPGNARELMNVVATALGIAGRTRIDVKDLSLVCSPSINNQRLGRPPKHVDADEVAVLARGGLSRAEIARRLCVSAKTLYRREDVRLALGLSRKGQ